MLIIDNINPASVYRPLVCVATLAFGSPIKKIVADIIADGSNIATLTYDAIEIAAGIYQANIDAQSIMQDYLAPNQSGLSATSSLGTNGSPYSAVNTDLFSYLEFSVTYLEQLPDGKLSDIGVIETIGTYETTAATVQNLEEYDLPTFRDKIAPPYGRLLTNSPTVLNICKNDSYYLSAFSDGVNLLAARRLRVQTFDSTGTLIQEALIEGDALINAFAGTVQWTVGVGVANLATTVFDQGALNILNPNVAYYEVVFGRFNLINFNQAFETFRFNIVDCCESYKVRLHFLNNKAGSDAITMRYKQQNTTTKSTIIQRPLGRTNTPPHHSPLYKGKYPINIVSTESYKLEYTLKSKNEGVWLQDLVNSSEVYVEIEGTALQSAIVLNATTLVDEKDEIGTFAITIQPANNTITMRN